MHCRKGWRGQRREGQDSVTKKRGKGSSMRRWDRVGQVKAAEHWSTGQKRLMLNIMERTVKERAGQADREGKELA